MAVHSRSEVSIPADGALLEGDLTIPDGAVGIVVFAHGSGSSRHSPRNRQVAEELSANGLATLLFDLLEPGEEQLDRRTGALRFDIALLGRRLIAAVDWLTLGEATAGLPIGCFGASTGAAAALVAAASRPQAVAAVVSRGGRPDLAGAPLASVRAATLLIVGGEDEAVLGMNQQAQTRLRCETLLEVVPGAGHLFEELGALERVELLARTWFLRWLGAPAP
ncbi:MAG TPA: alpha/beta family hydrolase [Solirubrobacteraceae bacterium]